MSFNSNGPPPKKKKIETSQITGVADGKTSEKCVNHQETTTNFPNVFNNFDINTKHISKEDLNKKMYKSNSSWASNHLQSIGQLHNNPTKVNPFSLNNKTMLTTKTTLVRNNDRTEFGQHHLQKETTKNELPLNVNVPKKRIDSTIAGDKAKRKDNEYTLNTVSSQNYRSGDVMALSYGNEKKNKLDNYQNKVKVSNKLKIKDSKPIQKTRLESKVKDKLIKDQQRILNTKKSSKCNKGKSKNEHSDKKTKPKQVQSSHDSKIKKYKTENDQKIKNSHSTIAKKVNSNIVSKSRLDTKIRNKLNDKNKCKTKLNKCKNSNSAIETGISEIKKMPDENCNIKQKKTNLHSKVICKIPMNSVKLNNLSEEKCKTRQDALIKSVLHVTEHFDLNKTQIPKTFTDNKFDRRSNLNGMNFLTCKDIPKKSYIHSRYQDGIPRENLDNSLITVEHGEEVDVKSTFKNKSPRSKSKTKSCKKIKLVINLICQKRFDTSIESSSSENSDCQDGSSATKDLSFLDDFNVDEIVESLKHSQNEIDFTQQKVSEQFVMTDQIKKSSIVGVGRLSPVKKEIKMEKGVPSNDKIVKKHIDKPIENGAIRILDKRPNTIIYNQCVKVDHDSHQVKNDKKVSNSFQNTDVRGIEDKDRPLLHQDHKTAQKLNHDIISENIEKNTVIKNETQSEPLNKQATETDQQLLNYNIVRENVKKILVIDNEEKVQSLNDQDVKCVQQLNSEVIIIIDNEEPLNNQGTETVQKTHNNIVTQQFNNILNTSQIKKAIKDKAHKTNVKEMSIRQVIDARKEVLKYNENIDVIVIEDKDQPETLKKQDSKTDQLLNNIISDNINQLDIIGNTENGVEEKRYSIKNQRASVSSNKIENIQNIHEKLNDSKTISDTKEPINMQNEMPCVESIISTSNEEDKTTTVSCKTKTQATSEPVMKDPQTIHIVHTKNKKTTLKDNKTTIESNMANPVESHIEIKKTAIPSAINDTSLKSSPKKEIRFLSQEDKIIAEKLEKRILNYLHAKFTVISLIRHGKFSKIYQCNDSNGGIYAIKKLNNECDRVTLGIYKENMLMQIQKDIPKDNLNCIHIVNGFGLDRYWCFLMEYYPKNLTQALIAFCKPFHINHVQDLSRQLLSAVMVLRNNCIVHSDIKPSHILLNATNDKLKLCGFDASYKHDCIDLLPNIGTAKYRAPEVILGYSAGYSIDVWSTALVMYEMATNTKLFTGIYNNDLLFKQMCIFGSVSFDMMQRSLFKDDHFIGTTFVRRVGFKGRHTILVPKFYKTNMLGSSLFRLYNNLWGDMKTKSERLQDLSKIDSFFKLLDGMLCIDPLRRLPIEFVCANPFIYQKFT